jgi:polyisoprenoid-binding protein YceI
MKVFFLPIILTVSLLISAFTFPDATRWKIDPKYSVKFVTGDHKGSLKGLKGTIAFSENELASSTFNISFDVNTIDLGDAESTAHAKEAAWLDEKNYPVIAFTSSAFTKTETGFEVKGRLNIKGVEKEISFPFTFVRKSKTGTFKGGFEINPVDHKISEEGMGETIKIEFQISVKQ